MENHPQQIVNPSIEDKIKGVFEEKSQRQSRSRNLIISRLSEMAVNQTDFTAEKLWQDLRQVDAHIGRSSVFRAVDILCQTGILHRIDFADGSHTFRACGEYHHHHLTCDHCHRVIDIELCLPRDQISQIGQDNHFLIEGHSLTLFGLCQDCQAGK